VNEVLSVLNRELPVADNGMRAADLRYYASENWLLGAAVYDPKGRFQVAVRITEEREFTSVEYVRVTSGHSEMISEHFVDASLCSLIKGEHAHLI